MGHHVTMVVMHDACTACVIANGLNMETLRKVAAQREDFTWSLMELYHPREAAKVEGLEVERFPALILDGLQISAGSVMAPRQLLRILEEF